MVFLLEERTITVIVDFAQNMELPLFGAEQPGETYYYTPLTINAFGIVDCSVEPVHLHYYLYEEFVGRKGGNNVASLIMLYLQQRGFLQRSSRKLVLVMDNCAGQNKNKMVLRLAPYLIERRFFQSVSFSFLVAGHTKNAADRLFNLAKSTYRQSNVYSMSMLMEAVTSAGKGAITCHRITTENMRDWNAVFDKLYKNFSRPKTKKWQIFRCERNTTMEFRTSELADADMVTQEMIKRSDAPRVDYLESTPQQLKPPAFKEIKQVSLSYRLSIIAIVWIYCAFSVPIKHLGCCDSAFA